MKVTLLFSKRLSDPTGASAVMRFLKEGKKRFKENNIDIDFFTRDNILPIKNNLDNTKKDSKPSVKERVMSMLRKHSKINPFAALLHKYIRTDRASKTLIDQYRKSKHQDDIVFIHELETCYRYLKSRKKGEQTKIILVMHDNGITYNTTLEDYPSLKNPFILRKLYKKSDYVFNNVDLLGFVSETSMKTFIKNNPQFPKEKIFFNLNGIPSFSLISKNVENSDVIRICCVGTVNERKGQRHIVEALNKLLPEEREKIHVTIVGDGNLKNELESICKKNDLTRYISFLGSRNDIAEILSQNDIFILPSKKEGLPISILEAMRQGLPIISTRVGGIPEMIEDGKSGLLIESSTQAVYEVFHNIRKYNWTEMGQESRKIFDSKFSLEKMIDTYSMLFNKAIRGVDSVG